MSEKETYLQKQLKFRDLKKFLGLLRTKMDDEGIIDDFEEFVDQKLTELILDEIKMEQAYKVLLKVIIEKLKDLYVKEKDAE